jgi:hypothetical protein
MAAGPAEEAAEAMCVGDTHLCDFSAATSSRAERPSFGCREGNAIDLFILVSNKHE